MKASKVVIIAGILMAVLLSACNRNAAEMVVSGGVTIDEALIDGKVNHCDITNLSWYVVPEFDSEMMTEYVFETLFSFFKYHYW